MRRFILFRPSLPVLLSCSSQVRLTGSQAHRLTGLSLASLWPLSGLFWPSGPLLSSSLSLASYGLVSSHRQSATRPVHPHSLRPHVCFVWGTDNCPVPPSPLFLFLIESSELNDVFSRTSRKRRTLLASSRSRTAKVERFFCLPVALPLPVRVQT